MSGVRPHGAGVGVALGEDAGALVVDRFLYTSMVYPGNYGFIPHTLSGDGDPCDVLVANTRAIIPGAIMSVRPVGVLVMEDNAGEDEKIIAVPSAHLTQRYDRVRTYTDLPDITIKQIERFFAGWQLLPPGVVSCARWRPGTVDDSVAEVDEFGGMAKLDDPGA